MAEEQQKREDENNEIKEMGTLNMKESGSKYGIQLLTIIGEIEGHDSVSGNTKATKYEHLLPRLAQIEEDDETDRITKFIASHSNITQDRLLELMLDSSQLVKDVGTMLEGEQAVKEGMIDEVGGIKEAFAKLHSLIDKEKEKQEKNLMT